MPKQETLPDEIPRLFGDYELIIDRCCGGDPKLKRRVAEADVDGRRGLAVLKYWIAKLKVQLPPDMVSTMETCEEDQEYYVEKENDMRNIQTHGSMRRVSITLEGNRYRRSFETIDAARRWRDRMYLLLWYLSQEKSFEPDLF
ncbi:hypothetical protein [Sulfitobacter sp. JB4-11]|uniref:hypothetical protein n=1 Tax=Sulfitobacter rhodophyticola TaxID=3238304 RepID=UPI003510DF38